MYLVERSDAEEKRLTNLLKELSPGRLFYTNDVFFLYHSYQILLEDRYNEHWNDTRLTFTDTLNPFEPILVTNSNIEQIAIEVLIREKIYWIGLEDIKTLVYLN
jgi:hypothetical protein